MKDFDLDAAKQGAAVCMRSGKAIEIITINGRNDKFPILAYAGSSARVMSFSEKGRYRLKYASNEDLMMRDDDYLERLERGEYESPSRYREGDPTVKEELTVETPTCQDSLQVGLTKREWFAGLAMAGIFAGRNWSKGASIPDCIDYARNAVELADALIAELEKNKGNHE